MKTPFFACLCACTALLFTSCNKEDRDVKVQPAVKPVPVEFAVTENGIAVNPYGYTPLSAQLSFYSVKSGRTFIRVHGRHGALSDVTHLFSDTGAFHSIPVIGMYADTANMVDIRIVDASGDTLAQSSVIITTQGLPANMPTSIVTSVLDENKVAPGMYLVSNLSTYGSINQPASIPYILDDYGDIRWVLDYTSNTALTGLYSDCGIARLRNGNFYFANVASSAIYETDVLGKIVNQWPLTGGFGFHHEVHEETNGNFLMTASKANTTLTDGTPTIEDQIIEIDRNTKQVITEWDLQQSLQEYRRTWGTGVFSGDWIHCNAVLEDTTDNTIIISGRNQGVIKLDRSNHVKWILAPHKDWALNGRNEDLKPMLLTPVDASGNPYTDTSVGYGSSIQPDFEWNCYQHSPILLPDGNLMIFDNGSNRTLDPVDGSNVRNGAPGKYSRAVEFKINTANMTVQQVWEYGKERDVDCYSSIISSVQFLPDNHVVFAPGYNVKNVEGAGGKIVEVDYATKQVLNEISISSVSNFSAHRVKKISVYPDNL